VVKLYRLEGRPRLYWEAWEEDGSLVIHRGPLGERGSVARVAAPNGDTVSEVLDREMQRAIADGYVPVRDEEHLRVMVQYPPERFAAPQEVEATWDRVERTINESLGWTGLGRCQLVDFSSELTFIALVLDQQLAVQAIREGLQRGGQLDGSALAVEREEGFQVVWPPQWAGEMITTE
jgi:hypothetical protein